MTSDIEHQVGELFRAKIADFCSWCAKNWTVTEEEALKDNVFDMHPIGYREGYNAALTGLAGALECWVEEGERDR